MAKIKFSLSTDNGGIVIVMTMASLLVDDEKKFSSFSDNDGIIIVMTITLSFADNENFFSLLANDNAIKKLPQLTLKSTTLEVNGGNFLWHHCHLMMMPKKADMHKKRASLNVECICDQTVINQLICDTNE